MRRSRAGLTTLGTAVEEALQRLQLDGRAREMRALLVWADVVGPQIAAVTEPDAVRDGVLHIVARTSTWASELTFHKQSILKGINQRLGKGTLRDLRFRQGRLSEGAAVDAPADPLPTAAELAVIALTEEETAEIALAVEAQADPDMAAFVGRLLSGERRRRQWLVQQGQRLCPRCGAHYTRAGAECPACRMERRQD
jgi:hypothetical protein